MTIKNMTRKFLILSAINWLILAVVLTFYTNKAHSATKQFESGMESGSYLTEQIETHLSDGVGTSAEIVTTIKAHGTRSSKQSLIRQDLNQNIFRSEIYPQSTLKYFNFNQEYWLGVNFYYDDWPTDTSSDFAPFQLHRRPSSWVTELHCGGEKPAWSVEPFYIATKNNTILFNTLGGINRKEVALVQKHWYSVVYHFDIGWDNDSYIEAWLDNVKLFRVDGPNHQGPLDDCNQPWKPTYINFGIYKWDWKAGRKATQSDRRILYIDDIKIYKGIDGYNQVYWPAAQTDTTPPVISGVSVSAISNTSATVSWSTDEPSDSTVNYGLTTSYGSAAANASPVTSHTINITGLVPGTTYHFRPSSKDAANNTGNGADATFITSSADTAKPVLSNPQVSVTATTATFTWTTNEPAGTRVKYYWAANTAGVSHYVEEAITSHSMQVSDLAPETAYTAKLTSEDAAGNVGEYPTLLSFTTSPLAVPPIISAITVTRLPTSATITWTTNVAASSVVKYGNTRNLTLTSGNATLVNSHSRTLSGLSPNRVYYYQIQSANANGDMAQSSATTFVTKTRSTQKSDSFQ